MSLVARGPPATGVALVQVCQVWRLGLLGRRSADMADDPSDLGDCPRPCIGSGTSLTDLAALAGADLSTVEVVPSDLRDTAVPVALPTAGTRAAIEAAGLSCR